MLRSIALLCLLLSAACANNAGPQAADMIVSGGVVIHPDSGAPPKVEDIIIADGRIVAAGLTDELLEMEDIVKLIDKAAPNPGRPKTYKKRSKV